MPDYSGAPVVGQGFTDGGTMNRVRAIVVSLAGTVAAGAAIVSGLLADGTPLHVLCPADGQGDVCTVLARPKVEQCASLARNGGDFLGPFEDGNEHALGRLLQTLREQGAIITWRTWAYVDSPSGPDFSRCEVELKLTREQAREWREVLAGDADSDDLADAPAELRSVDADAPRSVLAGEDPDVQREGFDLQERAP